MQSVTVKGPPDPQGLIIPVVDLERLVNEAVIEPLGHKNLNYTLCGAYEGNFGLSSNVFVSTAVMEEASALKDKWAKETGAFDWTFGLDSSTHKVNGAADLNASASKASRSKTVPWRSSPSSVEANSRAAGAIVAGSNSTISPTRETPWCPEMTHETIVG